VIKKMEKFKGNQSVISNESIRQEGTLILAYDIGKDELKSVGDSFGYNLVDYITKSYGSIVTRVEGVLFLRD
jgi:hypothetical protein